jgi:MFS family permease
MKRISTGQLRFNYIVNVLDGSFFGAALGFASFVTVIPLFVSNFTDSATLIGLIPAIHTVGWQLPQVITASKVTRLSRIKPMVLFMTVQERLPFLGLAVLAWFSPHMSAKAVLILTYLLLVWQGFGGGLTATAWQSLIAKIIPIRLLGTFYGVQSAAGNLLASIGSVMAGLILMANTSPLDFTLCFFFAGLCMLISLAFLASTREERAKIEIDRTKAGSYQEHLKSILKEDRNFRWFILARMAAQFSTMGFAFYTVYAVREFGIPEFIAGILTGLLMGAQVTANPVLGWLGDRRGHLRAFQLGIVAATISTLLAWITNGVQWFYPIFILAGIANVAGWTAPMAMTVDFSRNSDLPAYIGLANTLIAPSSFLAPIIGGWLADLAGFKMTFFASSLTGVITLLILYFGVSDPRNSLEVESDNPVC